MNRPRPPLPPAPDPEGPLLRPWRPEDAPAVLAAFAAPEMARQADRPVGSLAEAAGWIDRRTAEREAGSAYSLAVVDAGAGTVLGNVAVGAVNRVHGLGWVSYWTTPAARGRGVATYACKAVVRWAFGELGLFRLELGHRTDNPASCRVAEAAGFRVEGLQRRRLAYDGVRHDVELHARLATDPG
ncbi:GNAT family N-acetyltransferase [Streptomyces sp. G44]|uniref:GNAT family N-acetyltransferase n=1 Tax=Streptomyces sp. G44 TaxID=2807632 RepID=UPI0019619894|nr:GNAT family N-acetyltransferase [Streptomyces sp. G44]MBM7170628.1 GNAT family N-acetyltransferase [Streptomyces sp. G44]